MLIKDLTTVVIITMAYLFSIQASAKDSDKHQPIEIEADTLSYIDKTGIFHYQGNVRFEQGSILIKADNIIVTRQNQSVQHFEMDNRSSKQRAYFRQLDNNNHETTGQAMHIVYTSSNSILTMTGNAELHQKQDIIKAHQIIYNTETGRMTSSSQHNNNKTDTSTDNKRVRISITPD